MRWMIASLLFTLGCSGATPPSPCRQWHVSKAFSDQEFATVVNSAIRWNSAVDHVVLGVDQGAEVLCRVLPMTGEIKPETTVGHYSYVEIYLLHTEPKVFEIAAMHEFGHSLGLGHIPGYGIMSAVQGSDKITEGDVGEAKKAGWTDAKSEVE